MKKWAIITLVSAIVIVAALVAGFLYLHFSFQLRAYVYVHEERGFITVENLNEFSWKKATVEINSEDPSGMKIYLATLNPHSGVTTYYSISLEKAGIKPEDYKVNSVRITASTPIFKRSLDVDYISKPPDY